MTFLKGWRTRLLAGAQFVAGLVASVTPDMLRAISSDDEATRLFGLYLIIQAVITFGLRQITTTPPGKRAKNDLPS